MRESTDEFLYRPTGDIPPCSVDPAIKEFTALASAIVKAGLSAERLESHYRQGLLKNAIPKDQLLLIVVRSCFESGHKKATRLWTERLVENLQDFSSEDLVIAIDIAARTGQATAALQLCSRLHERSSIPFLPGERAAHSMVALAIRMRLPKGSSAVWKQHIALLSSASTLLNNILQEACTDEQVDQASVAQARIARLLKNKTKPTRTSTPP